MPNNFFAVRTRKLGRQQIAEECIGALAFDGPIGRLILAVFAGSALTLIIGG